MTKTCPFCAKEVPELSVKCEHCGVSLQPKHQTAPPPLSHHGTSSASLPENAPPAFGHLNSAQTTGNPRKKILACFLIFLVGSALLVLVAFALIVFGTNQYLNSQDGNPDFLLNKASIEGDIDRIKSALDSGADINSTFVGMSPLYWAAGENRVETGRYLIDHGAEINARNGPVKRTALHQAALEGSLEFVEMLIEKGADVNVENDNGRTALYYMTTPPAPLEKPPNADQIAAILREHGGKLGSR